MPRYRRLKIEGGAFFYTRLSLYKLHQFGERRKILAGVGPDRQIIDLPVFDCQEEIGRRDLTK